MRSCRGGRVRGRTEGHGIRAVRGCRRPWCRSRWGCRRRECRRLRRGGAAFVQTVTRGAKGSFLHPGEKQEGATIPVTRDWWKKEGPRWRCSLAYKLGTAVWDRPGFVVNNNDPLSLVFHKYIILMVVKVLCFDRLLQVYHSKRLVSYQDGAEWAVFRKSNFDEAPRFRRRKRVEIQCSL